MLYQHITRICQNKHSFCHDADDCHRECSDSQHVDTGADDEGDDSDDDNQVDKDDGAALMMMMMKMMRMMMI